MLSFLIPPGQMVSRMPQDLPALEKGSKSDFIVLDSDFLNQADDVHQIFLDIRNFCESKTRVLIVLNRWRSNFSVDDVNNFLISDGYEIVHHGQTFRARYIVARPCFKPDRDLTVSVVVPARNEAGNIESLVQRIPEMGRGTEIILIEGGSRDHTKEECERVAQEYGSQKKIKFLVQSRKGKGNAVQEAIEAATGDLIVILDSDLAIPPEELHTLYQVFMRGTADFVNASRLVYPLPEDAMPLLNALGNRFFGVLYGFLFGQKVKDLFAGTKLFRRSDYFRIHALRPYFKTGDVWGDVDLFFGAVKLGLKIQDVPVHYLPRSNGVTNMNRFSYLAFLMKMFFKGFSKLKPIF